MGASNTAATPAGAGRRRFPPFALAGAGLLALFTAAFAVHGHYLWQDRLRDAAQETRLLAQLFAQATESTFTQVAGNARVIGDRLLELDERDDRAAIAAVMQEFADSTPGFKRVVVLRTSGEPLYLSAPLGPQVPGGALRDAATLLTYTDAEGQRGLALARTFRNPFGDWVMPMRYAVRDRAGVVRLFVGGGMSTETGDYFLSRVALPEGYGVHLLRTDGYLQLAQPLAAELRERLYTTPLPDSLTARIAALAPGETGAFADDLGLDGTRRLGAHQRLRDHGLVAVVSVPHDKVLAEWFRQMRFSAALYLLFVLAGAGTLVAARRLQHAAERERSEAEAARARLAAVVETTGDAVITRRPNGEILTWNAAAERMFGWTAAEAIGRDISLISSAQYQHQARENTVMLEQGKPTPTFETVRLRKDGTPIDVQISISGVYGAQGRLEMVAAIFRDVTETRRIAAALRSSGERLEKIFRGSPAAIMMLQASSRVVLDVNETYERIHGWRREETVGRVVDDLNLWVDPAGRDRFRALLAADGRATDYAARTRKRDGAVIDVLVSGEIIEDARGEILLVMVLDVTEQCRAEAALRAANERLAKVFRNNPAAIVIADTVDGAMLDVNEAYERMFGWRREELVGQRSLAMGIWADSRQRDELHRRLAAQGRVRDFQARARRRNGEEFERLIAAEVIEEDGKRLMLAISIDLTERLRSEAALRESEERYRRLVEVSPDAIYVIKDAHITYANQGAARLFRASDTADLIGRSVYELTHSDSRDLARARLQALADGAPALPGIEYRFVGLDGAPIEIEVASARLMIDGEQAALVVARDVTERKRATAALQETKEFLQLIVDTSPDMIFVKDANDRLLFANQRTADYYGTSMESLLAKSTSQFHEHASEAASFVGAEKEVIRTRLRVTRDEINTAPDGTTHWFRTVKVPLVRPDGTVHVLGVATDITDRVLAEQWLRQSEDKFSKAFHFSPDWVVLSKPDSGDFIEVNEGFTRISGYSREQAAGRSILDLGLWVRPQERKALLEKIRTGAAVRDAEVLMRDRNGGLHQMLISMAVLEVGGEPHLLTVGRDVTEQKRTQAALRDSEQRYRALVDLSSDFYWRTDSEHRFVLRAGEILRRMNLPVEADYGKTRWEIGVTNLTEADWAAHRAVLARREEFRDLMTARRGQDGRLYWSQISGTPLFDASGAFLGYHGTGRDVTAEVDAQDALRRLNADLERKVTERTAELATANKELEAFSYSVSHDLRTPLRAIDGFSQVLLDQHAAQLDPAARRLLERVRAAAQRMGQLIADLLALSRVTRAPLQPEDVDLSALAAQVVDDLAPEVQGRRVEWHIAPGMRARCDAGLMRVLLNNLMGNALKYSRDASPARIEVGTTGRSGDRIQFFVRDNGAGFDMTFADRLFMPFQRLHGAHEFEGSGVGLATVLRIVARHGGSVEGEGMPGKGATFRFTLPA